MPKVMREISFSKTDAAKQIVYGEVYLPWEGEGEPPADSRDTDGHWMRSAEIEKAAHNFMANLRMYQVDKQHDEAPDDGVVVESFLAREGDPDFTPGSWVVGTKITKAETWEQIVKGEITGYSMAGDAVIVPDADWKGVNEQ